MNGMDTPKLINTLFFVPWVFLFYALLRRFVSSTSAIFFTLFMVITPEMFAHGAFSLTNYPCTVYTAGAVLCFLVWYEKRVPGFLATAALLMALGMWTRSDVVMVAGALLLVSVFVLIKEKNVKPLLFIGASMSTFVIWSLVFKSGYTKIARWLFH